MFIPKINNNNKNKHTKCDQEWGETGTLLHWWEYI